ncbi:MAG: PDZ domain-containing protein [Verrucomicrobiae bacterium]|nr:PDZ domain-containing protein [Verrucomicrobiae bacterium]
MKSYMVDAARIVLVSAAVGLSAGCRTPVPSSSSQDHATPRVMPQPGTAEWYGDAQVKRVVEAVYPALVRLDVVEEQGEGGRMQKRRVSGSGTIISKEGHILTNHHVAGRAARVICRLANREEVEAVLVGTDPLSDLAVLKIDPRSRRNPDEPLPFATFGDSDQLRIGDVVFAMGCPAGLSQSVTKGIVSNTEMVSPTGRADFTLDGETVGELVRWIGHDAVIYPGNSGGPLVNIRGEVVGVNEVGIGSLGGAIPSNLAKQVASELIAEGKVSRSWLGFEVQPLLKQMTNNAGILVETVFDGSPASAAGLQPGDIITEFNSTPVPESRTKEDVPAFNRLVLTTPLGATVQLKGLRQGKPMTWSMRTTIRDPRQAREVELKSWGLTVRNFTRLSALENMRNTTNGVYVDTVRPGGPCSECKPPLKSGDVIVEVNGQPVANVEELQTITRKLTDNETTRRRVLVGFERNAQLLLAVPLIGPEPQDEKSPRPSKSWLGVQTQVLTAELAEAVGIPGRKGVRVTQIVPGSAAERAGLRIGDILLKIDGQIIAASTPADEELFDNLVRAYRIGSEIELEGLRNGEPFKVITVTERQPKVVAELPEYKDDRFEFTVREISLKERVDDKLGLDLKGVRISAVQNAGWAALAGLTVGDVLVAIDGEPVENVAAVREKLTKLRETKPARVQFFIKRGVRTSFAEVEPKW